MTDAQLAVVISLDGTIASIAHRAHLQQAGVWDAYQAAACEDTPHRDVARALRILSDGGLFVAVITDQEERYRGQVLDWIERVGLSAYVDAVIVRPNGDRSPAADLRPRQVAAYFGVGIDRIGDAVAFIIDDRDQTIEAFRALGVPAWQVR